MDQPVKRVFRGWKRWAMRRGTELDESQMLLFLSLPASQIFQRGREIVFLSFFIVRRELERNLGWVATASSAPCLEYTQGRPHACADGCTYTWTHTCTQSPGYRLGK